MPTYFLWGGGREIVFRDKNKNTNKDLFIVDFSKIVNISARAIFRHEMMRMISHTGQ